MKVPSRDEKSILGTSSGTMHSCSNTLVMLIIETYLCDAMASLMRSWFGSGVAPQAVGRFKELWSFLQKILLKEMWLTPGQVLK